VITQMQARALAKLMEETHSTQAEPFTVTIRGIEVTFVDAVVNDRDGDWRQLFVLSTYDRYVELGIIKEKKG